MSTERTTTTYADIMCSPAIIRIDLCCLLGRPPTDAEVAHVQWLREWDAATALFAEIARMPANDQDPGDEDDAR